MGAFSTASLSEAEEEAIAAKRLLQERTEKLTEALAQAEELRSAGSSLAQQVTSSTFCPHIPIWHYCCEVIQETQVLS